MTMRRIKVFFLLSVMILSVAGCATRNVKNAESNETEATTVLGLEQESKEEMTEVSTEEKQPEITNVTTVTEKESPSEMPEQTTSSKQKQTSNDTSNRKANGSEDKAEQPKSKEQPVVSEPKKSEQNIPSESKEQPAKVEEPETPSVATYDPNQVRSLAISKCQAGGMITTEDNLAKNLAEGKITQEEYNAYYPLDGMENSYYSVFVETDLNQASTTSGRKLGSVDGIAQYIADMMLLEQDPVFNITYAGVTTTGGTDFYEFRCHR